MKFHKIYLTLCLGLLLTTQSAWAQFDQRTNTSTVNSKVDTLRVEANRTSEMLDFKIYNEAYDKYLRELQFKQRNHLVFKSGLSVTQTSFSYWAAGGMNSFAGRTYINTEHKYKAPRFNIHSTFDAALGFVATDAQLKKSEDYFNLSSSPSWRLSDRWELSASFILRSQFANGFVNKKDAQGQEYKERTSNFFAPAYLTIAPGVKYTNKTKTVEVFFAPSAGNMIMVLNKELADKGSFGVDPGRQFNPQFINYFRFMYNDKILNDKLTFNAKFESFWNYNHTSPRVISENKVGYKLTRLMTTSFYLLAIYDDKITNTPNKDNHLQLTETFGFGISYNIESKKHPAPPEAPRKGYRKIPKK